MKFEDGVKYFTKAYAIVEINFPEKEICCRNCSMYSVSANRCGIDRNIVPAYPNKFVGTNCPLVIKEE